jgi:murein DD-endopeptidase MepM/ murein hydrolase activator NlpD
VDYRYRDNFLDRRVGAPMAYNHVRGELSVRAHDGIDIYAPTGTPVLAPFDGVVIDQARRWAPWDPARYGVTVAILSQERTSEGYVVLLCHLDSATVRPGDLVARGQVVGRTGRSGNMADSQVATHLHLELRSPFTFPVREAGIMREMDAFNPYPSLRAADPHRRS